MNRKIYFFVLAAVLLSGMILQGCAKPSVIDSDDLKMVNDYIQSVEGDELPLEVAEGMSNHAFENKNTGEVKTQWQLVLDFIQNENSESPKEMDYSIVFGNSSVAIEDNEAWEFIGG